MEDKKDEMKIVPKDLVSLVFDCDENKIAVLNNEKLNGVATEDDVIMAKIVEEGNERILQPLTEEEYKKALKKYGKILKLYQEEE